MEVSFKKDAQPPVTLEDRDLVITNDDVAVIVVLSGIREEETIGSANLDGVVVIVVGRVMWRDEGVWCAEAVGEDG